MAVGRRAVPAKPKLELELSIIFIELRLEISLAVNAAKSRDLPLLEIFVNPCISFKKVLMKKSDLKQILLVLGLGASLVGWTPVQAAEPAASSAYANPVKELPFPGGKEWPTATEREKMAYLLGVLNMAMVEYQLTGPNPKHRTTVEKLVESLDGMTLRQIMETVDAYYQANPDQQQRPIFEVIWFEMVEPKIAASRMK